MVNDFHKRTFCSVSDLECNVVSRPALSRQCLWYPVHLWADSGKVFSTSNAAEATLFPDKPIVVDPYIGQDEPTEIIIEITEDTPIDESTDQTAFDLTPPDDNKPAEPNDQAELDQTANQKGLDQTSTILIAVAIVSAFIVGIIVFSKVQKNKKTTLRNNH